MHHVGRVTIRSIAAVSIAAVATLACGDGLGPENVTRLLIVDAANLEGTVGAPLSANPGVRAQTAEGEPVGGIIIRFEVESGDGQVPQPDQTTDPDGVARVGTWILGPTIGENELRASVPGHGVDAVISAIGLAGEPSTVVVVDGDGQTGVAGRPLAMIPTIRVTDDFGNPIRDVTVEFTVASGGGVLAPGPPVKTNSLGEARTPLWSLGPVPGENMLTVSAGSGTATIAAIGIRGPNDVIVLAGADQIGVVGQPLPTAPRLQVVDAQQLPLAEAVVRLAVTNGGSLSTTQDTTDIEGIIEFEWTLGTLAGENTLAAAVGDVPPTLITATGIPDVPVAIEVMAGNNQFAEVGEAVLVAPVVRVVDQFGNAVSGVDVTFTVTGGGGVIDVALATSDTLGTSSPGRWVLGPTPGTNTVEASIVAGASATISATALTAVFDLQIVREGGGGLALTAALNKAAIKWQTVLVGDLPDVSFADNPIAASTCGGPHDEIVDTIDDLRILVFVRNIDGVGGTAAQAGPCATRDSSLLPVLGAMTFDAEDIDNLANADVLDDVALHEMGHILGVGTLWNTFGFLVNPSLPANDGADTHFNGPLAIAAFDSIGGAGFPESKVPVENTRGGQGTRDSHWRESTMTNESMTGFIDPGENPLSVVTVQSLADLGYVTNPLGADEFTLPFAAPALAEAYRPRDSTIDLGAIDLGGDILLQPIIVVGRDGRTIMTIAR